MEYAVWPLANPVTLKQELCGNYINFNGIHQRRFFRPLSPLNKDFPMKQMILWINNTNSISKLL